jgi:hypothetical protein
MGVALPPGLHAAEAALQIKHMIEREELVYFEHGLDMYYHTPTGTYVTTFDIEDNPRAALAKIDARIKERSASAPKTPVARERRRPSGRVYQYSEELGF